MLREANFALIFCFGFRILLREAKFRNSKQICFEFRKFESRSKFASTFEIPKLKQICFEFRNSKPEANLLQLLIFWNLKQKCFNFLKILFMKQNCFDFFEIFFKFEIRNSNFSKIGKYGHVGTHSRGDNEGSSMDKGLWDKSEF